MDCNFSGHIEKVKTIVIIEAHEIPQSDSSRYLDSIISNNGEIDEDVKPIIKAGWLKWSLASEMLCD